MSTRPRTFNLIQGYENYSPLADYPAAKLMEGNDGRIYQQGYMYDFDDGRFLFFNGQMRRMGLVGNSWRVVPGQADPVADAIDAQRGGRGSITLIYDPDYE